MPLLDGDHVTDEDGTGFVHTAPGHGREDFDIWTAKAPELQKRGIDTTIPFTVDGDGRFTKDAPGFEGKRVIDDKGNKGDANQAVIDALTKANALIARGRLKHQYPHSWRSKKPVIFRNTPQWFIAMDKPLRMPAAGGNQTLRETALQGHRRDRVRAGLGTEPAARHDRRAPRLGDLAPARLGRADHRVRAQGDGRGDPVRHVREVGRADGSASAHGDRREGRRCLVRAGRGRALPARAWSPSRPTGSRPPTSSTCGSIPGSTHAFTLEDPKAFPGLAGIRRVRDGGKDRVMYLEGSDQHRGWFQSSLLESCGTRARAPFDVVLTHGFILDEKGEEKMSKSKGNTMSPQDIMKNSGADILRLWVASSDYTSDIRFGPGIIQGTVESYRKLRNTLRWMLGTLAHYDPKKTVAVKVMPELERLMLHRLTELDVAVRKAYAEYDYKRVVALLTQFMNTDLSAFYFDIRKDALYCEPDLVQQAQGGAGDHRADLPLHLPVAGSADVLHGRGGLAGALSVGDGVRARRDVSRSCRPPGATMRWREEWEQIKRVRRVVTGALEIERANKKIGSSLEAAPQVFIDDDELMAALEDVDFAEVCITSGIEIVAGEAPDGAFTLPDVPKVGVVPKRAEGKKCARSWRITKDVGSDPAFPELSARDAAAVREFDAQKGAMR